MTHRTRTRWRNRARRIAEPFEWFFMGLFEAFKAVLNAHSRRLVSTRNPATNNPKEANPWTL